MSKKKIILFDIDFTLSNREYLRKFEREYLSKLVNKSVEQLNPVVDRIIQDSWDKFGIFDIFYYAKRVSVKFHDKKLEQELVDMFLKNYPYEKALYPEVKPGLKKLCGKYILGIQSDGQVIFQLKKIESVRDFFDEKYIFIFKNKKEEIFEKVKDFADQIIVLDDKPDYIEKLLKHGNKAILMNRGPHAAKRDKYRIEASISSLKELEKFI